MSDTVSEAVMKMPAAQRFLSPGMGVWLCLGRQRVAADVIDVKSRTVTLRPSEVFEVARDGTGLLLARHNGLTLAYFGFLDTHEDAGGDAFAFTRASDLTPKRIRAHRRTAVYLSATLEDPVRRASFDAEIIDLSRGGAAIETEIHLPLGRVVSLRAPLEDGRTIDLQGYVRHAAGLDTGTTCYGLAFENGPTASVLEYLAGAGA